MDSPHGYELWKSDGTSSGTVLVKDIYSGSMSPSPQALANVNGTLYFNANDGVTGRELWKSDGTSSGTSLVADVRPTTADLSINTSAYTVMNGVAYFQANDNVHGAELWRTDGTPAGTFMLLDLYSGSGWLVSLQSHGRGQYLVLPGHGHQPRL